MDASSSSSSGSKRKMIGESETGNQRSILQRCSSNTNTLSVSVKIEDESVKISGRNHRLLLQQPCSSTNVLSKNSLYLGFKEGKEGAFVCYQIDPPNTTDDSTISNTNPVCRVPLVSRNCATAALGSKIYMLGGNHTQITYQGSTDVIFFDTATPRDDNDQFMFLKEENNHMLVSRSDPIAVSTQEGKMYVFGGNRDVPSWGEVFDPRMNTWSALTDPPPEARN